MKALGGIAAVMAILADIAISILVIVFAGWAINYWWHWAKDSYGKAKSTINNQAA